MEAILPRYLSTKQAAKYIDMPLSSFKKTWPKFTAHGLNPQRLPNNRLRFDRLNIDQVMQSLRLIKDS